MPYNESTGTYSLIVPCGDPETRSAQRILGFIHEDDPSILDNALSEFLSKNADYDDASDALGLVGQVSDLWRKVVKIKKNVIDGKELNGETVVQLLRDLFGHTLLALHYEKLRSIAEDAAEVEQAFPGNFEESVNRAAPEPSYFQWARDGLLAMKENGATWPEVHGWVQQLESAYGEPETMQEAMDATRASNEKEPESILHQDEPEEERKVRFFHEQGLKFEWYEPLGRNMWTKGFSLRRSGEVRRPVCGKKHSMLDVWCLRQWGHATGSHHSALLTYGTDMAEHTEYRWVEPAKATTF